jgi:hypothetical protein
MSARVKDKTKKSRNSRYVVDEKLLAKWQQEEANNKRWAEWFRLALDHGICPYCKSKMSERIAEQGLGVWAQCNKCDFGELL